MPDTSVHMEYVWVDGASVNCTVSTDALPFPDALDQVRNETRKGFGEALSIAITMLKADAEDTQT